MRFPGSVVSICCVLGCMLCRLDASARQRHKLPVIVITDLYHPYQDPGDNLDLVMGFALPEIDLRAIILDITDAFRKDTADHPTLWKDPRGPREAGIIPVVQLNYLFQRNVPFALGPLQLMQSETDKMTDNTEIQSGVELFLNTLRQSNEKVDVISFGSARVLAVAFNREPLLMKEKISMIHLSAGMAAPDFRKGKDQGANMIPGGEWNVAIDLYGFLRIMKSALPISLYPCAGIDGGFVKDVNNTYWRMPDLDFLSTVDAGLQRYFDYALTQSRRIDYLKAMDKNELFVADTASYPRPFHFWETAIWMNVTGRILQKGNDGIFVMSGPGLRNATAKGSTGKKTSPVQSRPVPDSMVNGEMIPIGINLREDGRFTFKTTGRKTTIFIYHRANPEMNEAALQQAYPRLISGFVTP